MDLSKHLDKAAEAVKRRNYKFAVNLYSQLLALQPDNGDARSGLRTALFKQAEQKKPSKVFAILGGGIHLLVGGLQRMIGKHGAAARSLERYLTLDPLNESANLKLAESLDKAGHRESALAVYRGYAEQQPRCLVACREAGALLYEKGEVDGALEMYERALKVDPRDQEALKARKNLAAEGALRKTGIESAGSSRDLIKDKELQRKLEKSDRLQLDAEEVAAELEQLEEQLAGKPDDVALLTRVADLRAMDKDLQGALDCLERAAQLAPEKSDLADRAGDLRLRVQEQRVAAAAKRGDDSILANARKAYDEMRVTEYRRRVDQRPTDLGLRFDLGDALLSVGQVDGAIAELQQAVKDPRKRTDALWQLGRAFRQKGLGDLAIGQLEKALESVGTGPRQKEILYEIGSVAEDAGDSARALDAFSKILEQDIAFQDVAQKVERLRSAS